MKRPILYLIHYIVIAFLLGACSGESSNTGNQRNAPRTLVFNEIVSKNDGINLDENLEADDWIEFTNNSAQTVDLSEYAVRDDSGNDYALPAELLAADASIVLWADAQPEQGRLHLDMKISAAGERLSLIHRGVAIDQIAVPALASNAAYARFPHKTGAFSTCRYATPNASNTETCSQQDSENIRDDINFSPYDLKTWPGFTTNTLALNELALRPAQFIELKNHSDDNATLSDYELRLWADHPGADNAQATARVIALPNQTLAPGEILHIALVDADTAVLEAAENFEGQVALLSKSDGELLERRAFMHWPTDAVLARDTTTPGQFRYCLNSTPGEENDCEALPARDIGNRVRGLYTPGDFAALAQGSGKSNIESVKFVIDLDNDDAVYLLGSDRWPLHYTFVREKIYQQAALDRCDALERSAFNAGWSSFSQENYFRVEGRQFLLGTLSYHSSAELYNVEYTFGDEISATQMLSGFYGVIPFTDNPLQWSMRPQDHEQVLKARNIEGLLPIVSPNAPFKSLQFQSLADGIAYGNLRYIPTDKLEDADLGQQTIVLTDDVPNDIAFVGGLITETFQTPLAHVNLLSQSRNTPNMALPDARQHPQIEPFLDQLVRFEVNAGGFTIKPATAAEAEAFWQSRRDNSVTATPRIDTSQRELVDLQNAGLADLPAIGAKAAQLGELFQVNQFNTQCRESSTFALPAAAFAIPVAHYQEHFDRSGARAQLEAFMVDSNFRTSLGARRDALTTVRQTIMRAAVDPQLMQQVNAAIRSRFDQQRVRFRSSSNTEDLPDFNGAGLYSSISGELDNDQRRIDVAIRTVWASLWNLRAYEERALANIDQLAVAMAILVHEAFLSEQANGVAVGRNILDPVRADQYYINVQAGEASVTNPAPGVITEQLIYQWPPRTPKLRYQSNSSLVSGIVLDDEEVRSVSCALDAIQNHFKPLLDPQNDQRWFAMDIEFKLTGAERALLIKQARPFLLGTIDVPEDCRDF